MTETPTLQVEHDKPLSLVLVGASGDLAQKKILPALFSLFSQNLLPPEVRFYGFARTPMTDTEFRQKAMEHLTCRYVPGANCAQWMDRFLARCHYQAGQYHSADSFLDLFRRMKGFEKTAEVNRLFYLAIPPSVFLDVAHALADAGLVTCGPGRGWSRVVMEKPFGRDRASSDEMARELVHVFSERQIYRIDHYLGKELVQNLLVLRFANIVFEPLWSREFIRGVDICWKEDIGIGSRGGYYDGIGVIRDVMQNHLLQILSLLAMERPAAVDARAVRDEKVKVLRAIPPLRQKDLVLGQYTGVERRGRRQPGYLEEPGVAPDSVTPTYAACVLRVENDRWRGVPFFMRAGKGLDGRLAEIRVRFRPVPGNPFARLLPVLPENDLIIRVQPDEAINLRIINKAPGLALRLEETALDLRYHAAFKEIIPDAYECLLLDALRGDKSLFIRADELAAAWDIFTPILHETEIDRVRPEPYPFGSAGPAATRELAAREGIECE
ncbi:MAG: glucose-6-phosphate dehydrogenase [Kiritimatiellae bacterium]|nr:glucose-6-phosphate dehydrogenase [Kiritimatiellia bacterium]